PILLSLMLNLKLSSFYLHFSYEYYGKVAERVKDTGDLVCKTFHEFWFEEPSGSQNQIFTKGSSVTVEIAKKTDQMSAKVVRISLVMLASVRKRCLIIIVAAQEDAQEDKPDHELE
ncbi:hypothetical protein Tco_0479156, partial [Tanacetum coccineum]